MAPDMGLGHWNEGRRPIDLPQAVAQNPATRSGSLVAMHDGRAGGTGLRLGITPERVPSTWLPFGL